MPRIPTLLFLALVAVAVEDGVALAVVVVAEEEGVL
jgi:hypothetical protein